jgi:CBS domain-containing membrane protein
LSPSFVLWLRSFLPSAIHVSSKERLRSCIGALIGIALTAGLTRLALGSSSSLPLLVAPMGASAVLLFAVPASPLAQPWSLIGGNLVSALVGITCAYWIGNPIGAAALAVPLAIGAMFYLRCIHPPSGAVALTAVLGGPAIHSMGYWFALAPIGVNSVALLGTALAYHHLTRHRYPHHSVPVSPVAAAAPARQASFTREDLEAVLEQRGELLDIDAEDLQDVLGAVETRAYRRHMNNLTCEGVMAQDVKSVTPETTADTAWALLHEHKIKALPVIDAERRVVGIVTQMDFVQHARVASFSELEQYERNNTGISPLQGGALVRDIMSAGVKTALASQPLADLVPMFAACGHHHLPVVGNDNQLRGMVTQANLVAGLHQHSLDEMLTAS